MVESVPDDRTPDPLALHRGIDLGVGEHDQRIRLLVGRKAHDLTVEGTLEPLTFGDVVNLHTHGRTLSTREATIIPPHEPTVSRSAS